VISWLGDRDPIWAVGVGHHFADGQNFDCCWLCAISPSVTRSASKAAANSAFKRASGPVHAEPPIRSAPLHFRVCVEGLGAARASFSVQKFSPTPFHDFKMHLNHLAMLRANDRRFSAAPESSRPGAPFRLGRTRKEFQPRGCDDAQACPWPRPANDASRSRCCSCAVRVRARFQI